MVCSGIFWSGQLLEMITVIVKITAEPSQLKLEAYATSYVLWVKTGNYESYLMQMHNDINLDYKQSFLLYMATKTVAP